MSSQAGGKILSERLVVRTILELSGQQRQRFLLYLDSPYFKVQKDIPSFFKVLNEELVEGEGEITDESFYALLFPGEPHSSRHLNRMFFNLLEALTDFLAQEHFQRQKVLSQVFSLKEMLEWRFDELYRKKHKKVLKELEKAQVQSESAWEQVIQFRLGFANYLLRDTSQGEIMEVLQQILQEQMGHAYLTQLKLYTAMVNRSLISGKTLAEEKPVPNLGAYTEMPLIQLYEWVVEMQEAMLAEDLDQALLWYLKLKEALVEQVDELAGNEAIDLYHHGLNFLSARDIRFFSDVDHRAEKYFWTARITKQMLSMGKLDWWDFYNHSISLVFHRKNLAAAKELLDEVGDKLAGDARDAATAFVSGLIQFAEKEYKEAGLCFYNVVVLTRMPIINIHCRVMYLRCLYELEDYGALGNHNEALRLYLHRTAKSGSMAKEKIEQFRTFNRLFKALEKEMIRPERKREKLENLLEKVEESETAFKGWLLEKAKAALKAF